MSKAFEKDVEQIVFNITANIGDYLKKRRAEKDLSIREISRRSGVSTAVISDIENGKSLPRIEILVKLALAMDILLDNLFASFIPRSFSTKTIEKQQLNLSGMLERTGLSKLDVKEVLEFVEFKKSRRRK